MAKKTKLYKKLARQRGSIGTYFSLWLAADHVLQIESNLMTERYQRVWLRDVQGLFIRPSRQSRYVSWVSLGLACIFALLIMLGDTAGVVFSVLTGLATLVLVYGLFFARNCYFHIVTAVQTSEWVNIVRLRKARKLIARLEPLILAAQREEAAPTAGVGTLEVNGMNPDQAVTT